MNSEAVNIIEKYCGKYARWANINRDRAVVVRDELLRLLNAEIATEERQRQCEHIIAFGIGASGMFTFWLEEPGQKPKQYHKLAHCPTCGAPLKAPNPKEVEG